MDHHSLLAERVAEAGEYRASTPNHLCKLAEAGAIPSMDRGGPSNRDILTQGHVAGWRPIPALALAAQHTCLHPPADEVLHRCARGRAPGAVGLYRQRGTVAADSPALAPAAATAQGKPLSYAPRPAKIRIAKWSPEMRALRIRNRRRVEADSPLIREQLLDFTPAEKAALAIIAREARIGGLYQCRLFNWQIAQRANIHPSTVKNAKAKAIRLGKIRVEVRRGRHSKRNEASVITFLDLDWCAATDEQAARLANHKAYGLQQRGLAAEAAAQRAHAVICSERARFHRKTADSTADKCVSTEESLLKPREASNGKPVALATPGRQQGPVLGAQAPPAPA